ncbi:glycosyltransferase family 39 protein [Planctopirus hydrillae]|uniref:Glycosyltransferase RgtA/B/C/D-like domain-containing protein n=1 Tax=Planctopirus hydrillae TaxID=1841610 RepID=A0A1C3E5L1_9PLAN|nr:glycosyltransferase family 39 protein [Planctopirus hydrillae]ODA28439.1 hypothetical protein A6X21_11990 [Planctopirus hydrillae]
MTAKASQPNLTLTAIRHKIPVYSWLALFLAMGLLGFASFQIQSTSSITFDETFYLNAGVRTVASGTLDPAICDCGVAPLPIIICYLPPLLLSRNEYRHEAWVGHENDPQLIILPRRLNTLLVGMPLLIVIWLWLGTKCGPAGASLGVLMTAASPTIQAHAALATTDLSFTLFGLLGILALAHYLEQPTWSRLGILAIAMAACLSAKYSGVFLFPVAGLMFLGRALRDQNVPPTNETSTNVPETSATPTIETSTEKSPLSSSISRRSQGWWPVVRQTFVTYTLLLLLVIPLWWAFHGFSFTGPLKNVPLEVTPPDSPWVEILGRGPWADWIMDQAHRRWKRPAPIAGVLFQYLHNKTGHTAFLIGETSLTGWRTYFPCTIGFKSTPSELILITLLLLGTIFLRLAGCISWSQLDFSRRCLWLSFAVLAALLLFARINIGHRYVLILYPLFIMLGIDTIFMIYHSFIVRFPNTSGTSKAEWPRVIFTLIGSLLLAMQLWSSWSIQPHPLSYFNGLCGGPEQGGRLLLDSNIDWGQDLPTLQKLLASEDSSKVALQYFGTALPTAYGIHADPTKALRRPLEDYELLAISVTHLGGLYVFGNDPYQKFRTWQPEARAGYSINLYRLDTPERKAAFAQAIQEHEKARAEYLLKQ